LDDRGARILQIALAGKSGNTDPVNAMQPEAAGSGDPSARLSNTTEFRVRYSETDQMGTYYNSRPLEWFECGRTELLRRMGLPYTEMEARGAMLPLVEAHVEYQGRARYDDPLHMTTHMVMAGRARIRCDVEIVNAETGRPVARGYTIHVFADPAGKAIRPPGWFLEILERLAKRPNE
jgi:acyl-CoA thioester hydrolase